MNKDKRSKAAQRKKKGSVALFPTRKEVEKMLSLRPAEVLENVELITPSEEEVKEFLQIEETPLKSCSK